MHVPDLAHTCGSVARSLAHAYVKGCECICVVHDLPGNQTGAADPGRLRSTTSPSVSQAREPMRTLLNEPMNLDACHLIPRIF